MVVNLLFLFALYFSITVEVVQTLIHSDHMDPMHQPEIICIVAAVGILLNGVCVLMIGGILLSFKRPFTFSELEGMCALINRLYPPSG